MSKSKVAGRDHIPEFKTNKPTGVNWLLVIAIDEYVNRPLNNCVRDVKAFVEIVTQRYNIEQQHIIPLFNEDATADNIYQAFEDLLEKVQAHDNLIVYYSGHGDYHGRLKEGYWIPFDAETRAKHIANDALKRYLREIRTRHTLIICDSCFSGTFAVKGASDDYSPEALVQRYQDASRWVITSGSKQEVLDGASGGHSPFAEALLAKLRAHMGDLSARALGDAVISDLAAKKIYQKPLSEAFDKEDHQGGLFVFFQKQNAAHAWTTTQATDTAAAYYDFWQQHPDSLHAEEALWRYANKEKTSQSYNFYLRNAPDKKHAIEAIDAIEDINDENAWKEAIARNVDAAYWRYIHVFPTGKYVQEAHQRINDLHNAIVLKTPAPKIILPDPPKLKIPPSEDRALDIPGFSFIKGGTFEMGDVMEDKEYPDEEIVHTVTVSDFYMGKYAVTFDEYDAFCNATKRSKPSDEKWGRTRRPVINVDWYDAVEYCNWRSEQEGLGKVYDIEKRLIDPNNQNKATDDGKRWYVQVDWNAKGYRLPTEAEWEYAARASPAPVGEGHGGAKVRFGNGKDIASPLEMNFDASETYKKPYSIAGEYRGKTLPVGSFQPNSLDLYDMSGNVWEWCWDWYGEYPPVGGREGELNNPKGAAASTYRVGRGGSWYVNPSGCRAALRSRYLPTNRFNLFGFRLVRH